MGRKLVVYTDNDPLTHVLTSAKPDATGRRWASALGAYNFDIIYRAGYKNTDADSMSRYLREVVKGVLGNIDQVCIGDQTVKAICTVQVMSFIEILSTAPINIVEATDSAGQSMAHVKVR